MTDTTFARILQSALMLGTADDVIEYFEKPWHWQPEYDIWIEAGKPTGRRLVHLTETSNTWETTSDRVPR